MENNIKEFSNGWNLQDTTIQHIEDYIDQVLEKYTRSTANAHLVAIKSFFTWYAGRYNSNNPASPLRKLKADAPRQRVLSPEEYEKVLDVAEKEFEKEVIQFLGNTGLRRSEFRSLTWENVNPNMEQIIFTGKGRKQRIVPLNSVCQKILKKYKQGHNTYIPFVQKYQSREGLYLLCQRLAKRAGILSFGPHALRHFFATRLVRKGVPLIKVSKILGHSSIQITEKIYLHLLPQDFLGVTDCLDF